MIVPNPNPPTPAATTSNYAYLKPIPIRPKSAQRQQSQDIEVDIGGMSPEPSDAHAQRESTEQDPESEEIVRQLEKGLPRWPGFGEEGWMDEVHPVSTRIFTLMHIAEFALAGPLDRDCACYKKL